MKRRNFLIGSIALGVAVVTGIRPDVTFDIQSIAMLRGVQAVFYDGHGFECAKITEQSMILVAGDTVTVTGPTITLA